jgi:hypothetical protein
MGKKGVLIALSLAIVAFSGWAQEPTYNLDVDPVTSGIQTATTVNVNDSFLVQVVMTNADRLLGYSFDLDFPEGLVELVAVYENPGDLNFDSNVGLDEVNAGISFFIENQTRPGGPWPLTAEDIADPQQFIYPRDPVTDEGPRNGILLDMSGDNALGLDEVNMVISEFILDQLPVSDQNKALGQVQYWTDLAADRAGENESVEISDPPSVSNAAGRADDITGVLLARPDRVVGGTRPGFGLSGDLVLVTAKFKAIAAGVATLSFVHEGDEHPVYIDEDFQNILTDVHDVLAGNTPSSTVTINP